VIIKRIRPGDEIFSFKSNEYIPLEMEIGNSDLDAICLRYCSDYSLLELGVSSRDVKLISIKLVMIPSVSEGDGPAIPSNFDDDGIPIFDLSCWNGKKYFDIDGEVKVLLNKTSIILIINESWEITNSSLNHNVRFGISNGSLCWISFENVNEGKILEMRKMIDSNKPGVYL
jgi:hypothetical protein